MSAPTRLIVGLGNPGDEYAGTRHNLGWEVLDSLTESLSAERTAATTIARPSDQFRAGDVLLIKPNAFMNRSGPEVRRIADYYGIEPPSILLLHDELDLPFGTVQLKTGGGTAGHRGVVSVADALGVQEFTRLRLGIGRPPEGVDPANFVLGKFRKEEAEELPKIIVSGVGAIRKWLNV